MAAARKSPTGQQKKPSSGSKKRAPSTRASSAREKLAEYRRKRDFSRTAEPSGSEPSGNEPSSARDESARSKLRFVIQKHAASHLHFDFRLELDGVMKSWAVPKGPSYDPATKRLAMEVEDHPIAYNTFEGTIPAGEYGGGTVMLWDRGTYGAPGLSGPAGVRALREGYEKGRLDLVMHGERLQGGWALVRMRETAGKPQWLLIKRHDDTADPSRDVVAEVTTSVTTGRTMDEIAAGKGKKRVWHSNREAESSVTTAKKSGAKSGAKKSGAKKSTARKSARSSAAESSGLARKSAKGARKVARKRAAKGASAAAVAEPPVHRGRPKGVRASKRLAAIVPMKCSIGTGIPAGDNWTYEPKYDGIRVIAYATAEAANLVTRNGNDKSFQFPEVIGALRELATKAKRPLVLDGEIVALDGDEVARFQDLQSRMHTTDRAFIESAQEGAPASLVAFDLLVDGDEVITGEPWTVRRARLEQRLRNRTSRALRLGETVPNDGEELLRKAEKLGWEGVIAKRMDEPYTPGARSRGWLKLKIEHRQEFVVGGWTEPRNTREHIGALLLGHYDADGSFVYVGHTGGGFTSAGLRDMYRLLAPLERATSPFSEKVKTNEKAHWVTPKIVVEVKFGEWTADGKLRQPIFLGTRDDKPAREVTREAESVQDRGEVRRGARAGASARAATKRAKTATKRAATKSAKPATTAAKRGSRRGAAITDVPVYANDTIVKRLLEIETEGGRGTVALGRGASLDVSSLDKVYFPKDGITKGALMRYYATVAPLILPTVKDRALVLKRTPEGIDGETFFQQKAPPEAPEGVRVESVPESDGDTKDRLVGGDITTLLYCVQLGCVSTDPWHSRVQSPENPDYTYIDIDPQPKAGFQRVLDCARWAKEELDALGLNGALKTSGSRGLHIAIPLPPSATWETAVTLAQIIAARVAEKHPKDATITRAVGDRSPKSVYMDYLQNIRGKSVAGPYCVRAKPGAMVSTPLEWSELTDDLDPHEYTVETAPLRFKRVGDLWRDQMKARNSAAALKGLARVKKR